MRRNDVITVRVIEFGAQIEFSTDVPHFLARLLELRDLHETR